MRTLLIAIATLGLVAAHGSVGSAASASFRVVVHESNPTSTLPSSEIQRLFMKKARQWDHGPRVAPVDQTTESTVRRDFSRDILNRSVGSVTKYWLTQVYSGRETPPQVMDSDREVMEFVASNRGAIGYVSADARLTGVKAIEVTR